LTTVAVINKSLSIELNIIRAIEYYFGAFAMKQESGPVIEEL
jgi:hypothetical protein